MQGEEKTEALEAIVQNEQTARAIAPEKKHSRLKKQAEENATSIAKMTPVKKLQALKAMPKEEKGATLAALAPEQRKEILKDLPPEEKQEALEAIQLSKQVVAAANAKREHGGGDDSGKTNAEKRADAITDMDEREQGLVLVAPPPGGRAPFFKAPAGPFSPLNLAPAPPPPPCPLPLGCVRVWTVTRVRGS